MQISNSTRALVLGASREVGRAMARMLAQRGARLVLTRYDWPESADEMEAEFPPSQGHLTVRADLRRRRDVEELARRIQEEHGALDILVNNIERGGMPILHGDYAHPLNQEQWDREMATCLKAKHLVFHACLPLLRQAPRAVVVNVSSIAGLTGRSGPAGLLFSEGYAAASRGVSALTVTWARLGAPSVRVCELMLGLFDGRHGPGTRGWDLLDQDQRQAILAHILSGRTGRPAEAAHALAFLIEADYMTGACLRLDGGYVPGAETSSPMPPCRLED